MIYLASPYSHEDSAVRQRRYEEACRAVADLLGQSICAISPIAHGHSVETVTGRHFAWDVWIDHSLQLMRHCSRFAILQIEGWSASQGVQLERVIWEKVLLRNYDEVGIAFVRRNEYGLYTLHTKKVD